MPLHPGNVLPPIRAANRIPIAERLNRAVLSRVTYYSKWKRSCRLFHKKIAAAAEAAELLKSFSRTCVFRHHPPVSSSCLYGFSSSGSVGSQPSPGADVYGSSGRNSGGRVGTGPSSFVMSTTVVLSQLS